MAQKRQLKFSRLFIATIGFGILFFALNIIQTSCGGGGTEQNNAVIKSKVVIPGITPALSGVVPLQVPLPPKPDSIPVNNRPFFDQFSWQTFIALCWPVVPDQRGAPLNPNDPNTFLNMTNSTPVVWTSYKNQWDLFGQGTDTPAPWNSWENPVSLCQKGQKISHVFGSAKSSMLPGDGDESFSVPLVDQNRNYALFEIKYNEIQYNFIVDNQLYNRKQQVKYMIRHGDSLAMPISDSVSQGSILVKAAWKQLGPEDDASRYYIIDELVYDPVSKQCTKKKMGLVGLHIARKVQFFPQWVWSSFEQVDNVPGAPNAKPPYSFNNGTGNPATIGGYAKKPGSAALIADPNQRVPVQVTRFDSIPSTPIGSSTVDINRLYQASVGNTWMQYYQLVITQWPTKFTQFATPAQGGVYPQDCGQAFPVNNCVNTTMETYFQSQNDAVGAGGNSCMSCHYTTTTDFSWSVQLRAH